MSTAFSLALSVGLWWGVIAKLRHLRRSPGDRPLAAVTGLLFCLAIGPLPVLPVMNDLVEEAVPGLARLWLNLFTVTATYCLMAFYGYSVGGPGTEARLRRRLFGLFAAQAVMIAAWSLAPLNIRLSPGALENLDDWHGALFTVAALGYMAFGLGQAFWWSVRYARAAHRTRLRTSLRIVSVALAALLIACLAKSGVALALGVVEGLQPEDERLVVLSRVYPVLVLLGTALIVIGFCYPAVASVPGRVRQARRRRRLYHSLGPLWVRMREAFPHLVLDSDVPGFAGGWLPWTYRAYFRRVIEIRDMIVQLAPYYDPEVAARAASAQTADPEIWVRARLTENALRRKQAGRPVEEPYVLPAVGGDDLDSDARWLARLARAMTDQSSVDAVSSSTSSIRNT